MHPGKGSQAPAAYGQNEYISKQAEASVACRRWTSGLLLVNADQ